MPPLWAELAEFYQDIQGQLWAGRSGFIYVLLSASDVEHMPPSGEGRDSISQVSALHLTRCFLKD